VAFEVKTADDFKRDFKPTIWVTQARSNASDDEPSPTIYFPRGLGAANVGNALSIQPLHWEMRLLEEAGYTPRLSREAS
jgi:hypothetical protein